MTCVNVCVTVCVNVRVCVTVTACDRVWPCAMCMCVFQFPLVFLNDLKQSEAGHANVNNNLALLETFLTRSSYLAGESLTVADLATFANISTMEAAGLDLTKYPHVNAWLQKLKEELTYAEAANGEGAKMLGGMYQTKLKELGGK